MELDIFLKENKLSDNYFLYATVKGDNLEDIEKVIAINTIPEYYDDIGQK